MVPTPALPQRLSFLEMYPQISRHHRLQFLLLRATPLPLPSPLPPPAPHTQLTLLLQTNRAPHHPQHHMRQFHFLKLQHQTSPVTTKHTRPLMSRHLSHQSSNLQLLLSSLRLAQRPAPLKSPPNLSPRHSQHNKPHHSPTNTLRPPAKPT